MRFQGHFLPTWHEERLLEPYEKKRPSIIFVCSMGELFGDWVQKEYVEKVLKVVKENPRHIFVFLTKCPWNLYKYDFPKNAWVGVSITNNSQKAFLTWLFECNAEIKIVCYEPLLENIKQRLKGVGWVIIGGQTGPKKFIPPEKWIEDIIIEAKKHSIPVFIKKNAHYPIRIEEYPKNHIRR